MTIVKNRPPNIRLALNRLIAKLEPGLDPYAEELDEVRTVLAAWDQWHADRRRELEEELAEVREQLSLPIEPLA